MTATFVRMRNCGFPQYSAVAAVECVAVACFAIACSAVLAVASDDLAGHTEVTYVEPPVTDSDRDHWSLKPRATPEIPQPSSTQSLQNEIDHFIAAELERRGLRLQPEASRSTLIRRLSFDLTGLPPAPEEIADLLSDESPDPILGLVDRLLTSSACGERWAQHWLDLARFAETDGYEHDHVRPDAWRYRDWVIKAFNCDLPFDEFVRLQIAGDLISPNDENAAIATQFCLSGPDMPDINSQEERRHTLLNEMTATIGEVFLGLQLGCAQCHDHKYDPVSQADFYRLRAFFEPAVSVKKNASVTRLTEDASHVQTSQLMIRGDFRRPGPELFADVPRVLRISPHSFGTDNSASSKQPRLDFANWLVHPDNPLTARVIVNRVWQQHFGRGLCESPGDFGVMGEEPVNPPLLDWLAEWFVRNNWSLRGLHRLIVTSATYRQRSSLDKEASPDDVSNWQFALEEDRDCRLLSRFPRQRLQGEMIRDALLQAADALNRRTGGPGVRPPLPAELRGTLLKDQWVVNDDEAEHDRRSIYVFARRNLRYPIFEAFDRPAANETCSRRSESTTAPQALYLMNSEFTLRMSRLLALQVLERYADPEARIEDVFQRIFGRRPSAAELADTLVFVKESGRDDAAFVNLCLSLFNANEFLFVD